MKKSTGLVIACIFMLIITMIPLMGMQHLANQPGADISGLLGYQPTGAGTSFSARAVQAAADDSLGPADMASSQSDPPPRPGGYYRNQYNQWKYHEFAQPGYIYYPASAVEPTGQDESMRSPVQHTQKKQVARSMKCAGTVVVSAHPTTGETSIAYVGSAKQCG